jgi:hypothetical protein
MLKTIKKHLILLWEAYKEGEIGLSKRIKDEMSLREKVNQERKHD